MAGWLGGRADARANGGAGGEAYDSDGREPPRLQHRGVDWAARAGTAGAAGLGDRGGSGEGGGGGGGVEGAMLGLHESQLMDSASVMDTSLQRDDSRLLPAERTWRDSVRPFLMERGFYDPSKPNVVVVPQHLAALDALADNIDAVCGDLATLLGEHGACVLAPGHPLFWASVTDMPWLLQNEVRRMRLPHARVWGEGEGGRVRCRRLSTSHSRTVLCRGVCCARR